METLEEDELLDRRVEASLEVWEQPKLAPLRILLLAVVQQRLVDPEMERLRLASDLVEIVDEYLLRTDMDSQRMQELEQFYLVVLAVPG